MLCWVAILSKVPENGAVFGRFSANEILWSFMSSSVINESLSSWESRCNTSFASERRRDDLEDFGNAEFGCSKETREDLLVWSGFL